MSCCASRPAKKRAPAKQAAGGPASDNVVRRTAGGEDGTPVSVVLLGEESCGKTSLVQRFTAQDFRLKNEVNMGAALTERVVIMRPPAVERACAVQLNIWDTPGSTKVHHLAHMYYKSAESAVVVYDVTSIASFEIMKSWVSELKSLGPRDIRLVIAANKCDCDDRREVTSEQLRTFAQESGAEPFEVSARTGKGVDKMFKEAAKGAKSVSEEHQVGMLSDLRKTAGEGAARLARRGSLDRGPK